MSLPFLPNMLSQSFRNPFLSCCSTPHCARFLRGPEGSAATPICWNFPNARSLRQYPCRSPSSSACLVICTTKGSESPCSYETRSHIATLEAETGPLDCKSTQIRLYNKLPEEKIIEKKSTRFNPKKLGLNAISSGDVLEVDIWQRSFHSLRLLQSMHS